MGRYNIILADPPWRYNQSRGQGVAENRSRRLSASVHQLIVSPIEAHSKKPDSVRDKIVELMGALPRVELFARQKTEGWDVWDNEVDSTIRL